MNNQASDVSVYYKDFHENLNYGIGSDSMQVNPIFKFTHTDPVDLLSKYAIVNPDPDAVVAGHESSGKDMLSVFNTERRTMKYSATGDNFKVIENYDTLSPLEELNLASCGDSANFFKEDISGASMGDGTLVYNGYPIGPTNAENCPAGDSKFNYFSPYNKFRANFS